MLQPTILLLTIPFLTLLLATDPRLLDRSPGTALLRRAGEPQLELTECGRLPDSPRSNVTLHPGMQLTECRRPLPSGGPIQRTSSMRSILSQTNDSDLYPLDTPSLRSTSFPSIIYDEGSIPSEAQLLRTSSTFSITDDDNDNDSGYNSLLPPGVPSFRFPSIPSKSDIDRLVRGRLQRNSIFPKSDDDDLLPNPFQRDSIYTNPSDDDSRPGPSNWQQQQQQQQQQQRQRQQPPISPPIGYPPAQIFNSGGTEATNPDSAPFLGHDSITSYPVNQTPPAHSTLDVGRVTPPQQEQCLRCVQECAGPDATPEQAVAEFCGGRLRQKICTEKGFACVAAGFTCCALFAAVGAIIGKTT